MRTYNSKYVYFKHKGRNIALKKNGKVVRLLAIAQHLYIKNHKKTTRWERVKFWLNKGLFHQDKMLIISIFEKHLLKC